MTFFSLVFFLHVVAALSIFAVLVVEVVALTRIRRALTFEEALRWIDVSPGRLAVLIGSPPVSCQRPRKSGCWVVRHTMPP